MKELKNERLLFSITMTPLSCQAFVLAFCISFFERLLSNGLHVLLDVLSITLFIIFKPRGSPLIRQFNFYTRIFVCKPLPEPCQIDWTREKFGKATRHAAVPFRSL
jgi:hypothetical protein